MGTVASTETEVSLAAAPRGAPPSSHRLVSLDVVRGAVMALMALDHVRWFFSNARFEPTNLERTTTALFLTRWVTHFCAPAFLFLAGTGAYLHGRRLRAAGGAPGALARFLLTRGAWLIIIEFTLVRFGWTFNVDYAHYLFGGVIWMIGWCLIGLGLLVRLPTAAVGAVGGAILLLHNAVGGADVVQQAAQQSALAPLWQVLYYGGGFRLGESGPAFPVLFAVLPWLAVICLGYAFGAVMVQPPAQRRRLCLQLGLGAVALFLVLRGLNLYGDPNPWSPQRSATFTLLSFLNTTKYPASLLYVLMTLGPVVTLLPALERVRGKLAGALVVFGRVPFFYYVLHLPAIHSAAVLFSLARYGEVVPWLVGNHPMMPGPPPEGYGYGLGTVYLMTLVVLVVLWVPSRWFAALKSRRRDAWLSFL